MNILDQRFRYTPSTSTNIVNTWKRNGYKPTTEAERRARQMRRYDDPKGKPAAESPDVPATPIYLQPLARRTA